VKKQKMEFPEIEDRTIKVLGNSVTVRPYLSIAEQVQLIVGYVNAMFFSEDSERTIVEMDTDLIGAETNLIFGVLDLCTSIDVEKLDINDVVNRQFHDEIFQEIDNFLEFRDMLDAVVALVKEKRALDKSVGGVLDFIFEQVLSLLEQFKDIDSVDVKEMASAISELGKTIEKSRLSGLLDKK